jgi:putative acetyltransferase
MIIRSFDQTLDESVVIAIIDGCYREHGDPGIHLEGFDADLLKVDQEYRRNGGEFVVLESDGKVVGSHAVYPLDKAKGLATFRRLYLKPEYRGSEHGNLLMQWAIDWVRERSYKNVEFWSDVRFERAHAFFGRFGFNKTGEIRHCSDYWLPYSEFRFTLELKRVNHKREE